MVILRPHKASRNENRKFLDHLELDFDTIETPRKVIHYQY